MKIRIIILTSIATIKKKNKTLTRPRQLRLQMTIMKSKKATKNYSFQTQIPPFLMSLIIIITSIAIIIFATFKMITIILSSLAATIIIP